jgi:hypothetical protein
VEDDISDVISERRLSLARDDGSIASIIVRIGRPLCVAGPEVYRCHFQFLGFDNNKIRYAEGDDSMQALILALTKIASHLYTSAEFRSMRLTLDGQCNLGFPLFVSDHQSTLFPDPIGLLLM